MLNVPVFGKLRKTKENGGSIYNLLGDVWFSKTISWKIKGGKKYRKGLFNLHDGNHRMHTESYYPKYAPLLHII